MAELMQLLCGKINLYEETDAGKVLRPHYLQVSEGVCAHEQPAAWAQRTAPARGDYLGLQGDADWPVHVWNLDGASTHGIVVPPAVHPWTLREVGGVVTRWQDGVKPHPAGVYRPEVWLPSGAGAGPVRYDRVWPESEGRVVHPEPSVSSRAAEQPAVWPKPVLKLAELAREAGWGVRTQYARGRPVHGSTGRPLAEQESWALRFGGHPMIFWQAYAVRMGAGWKDCKIWSTGQQPMAVGFTDLEYWLANVCELPPLWLEHVQALRQDAAWRAGRKPKAAAKSTGGVRAEHGGVV